ncbi:MAG: 3-oxoacyl-ACP synthase III [Pirellulales bacterium]|nr:3-oxoacyl-ACP synthase III [Pirellulales bacterium]
MSRHFQFSRVRLAAAHYSLPAEVLGSGQLETALAPLYERLRLPPGRLELMTGIRERRLWPRELLPGKQSARTAAALLQQTDVDPARIGALVHGSVCRDYLEPSTACGVHAALGLSADCLIYDVSNACLGLLNGMLQVATLIELGQIDVGLVVGTESSRALVETTIRALNEDLSLTRESVKSAIASLTIGSGSAAVLLTRSELSPAAPRLTSMLALAKTEHHQLCHSDRDEAIGSGMAPLMRTDSELLMRAGIAAGQQAFDLWLDRLGWQVADIQKTVCHQVGLTHRKLLLETLGLSPERDFYTVDWLGNTGSTALPITYAIARERGFVLPTDRVALLGIGSGINVLLAGLEPA